MCCTSNIFNPSAVKSNNNEEMMSTYEVLCEAFARGLKSEPKSAEEKEYRILLEKIRKALDQVTPSWIEKNINTIMWDGGVKIPHQTRTKKDLLFRVQETLKSEGYPIRLLDDQGSETDLQLILEFSSKHKPKPGDPETGYTPLARAYSKAAAKEYKRTYAEEFQKLRKQALEAIQNISPVWVEDNVDKILKNQGVVLIPFARGNALRKVMKTLIAEGYPVALVGKHPDLCLTFPIPEQQ
jgi:hypothetical protein